MILTFRLFQATAESYSSPPTTAAREAFTARPDTADKATQILPDDPELFVFDDEVSMVLEALVAKTMEASLLEVIEEEEAAAAIAGINIR